MISLWRDRVLLTNVVFSRRRMRSDPTDFDTNRRVFRGCTIKDEKALGRWRSGAPGVATRGGPRRPGHDGAVLYRYRGYRSRLGCAVCSRQETCIGRGVCAGLLSTGTGFCYSQFWLSFLSRRGSARTVEFFIWVYGSSNTHRYLAFGGLLCFLLGRGLWQWDTGGGFLGFVLIARAVERLRLSRWSYGKIKRKQDRIHYKRS